jgi:hypothetical protein
MRLRTGLAGVGAAYPAGKWRTNDWYHPVTTVCPISRSNWFLPPRREWRLAPPAGRRRLGVTDAGVAKPRGPAPMFQRFFLPSTVRLNRNDSVPVSMMCARSVIGGSPDHSSSRQYPR